MIRFFSVTHCGMGVPPVVFVRARAGRPCHNASLTAHADSTESRDLRLGFSGKPFRDRLALEHAIFLEAKVKVMTAGPMLLDP